MKKKNTMLTWISDEALRSHVKVVLHKGRAGISKAEKDFARNAIDPFSALFDAGLQNISGSSAESVGKFRFR